MLPGHGSLIEMSSAVTLTDPVCSVTQWSFILSCTDVCCCQSHELKNGTSKHDLTPADSHILKQPSEDQCCSAVNEPFDMHELGDRH